MGDREFALTLKGLSPNSFVSVKTREKLTVDESGNSFNGVFQSQFFDAWGECGVHCDWDSAWYANCRGAPRLITVRMMPGPSEGDVWGLCTKNRLSVWKNDCEQRTFCR